MKQTLTHRRLISLAVAAIAILALALSATPAGGTLEGWVAYRVNQGDTLQKLFGPRWRVVAHLNRLDPQHLRAGAILRVPLDLDRDYVPLPSFLKEAAEAEKFILISLDQQFLGAYEWGALVKAFPVSSGQESYPTPTGRFSILEKDVDHESNLYTLPSGEPFPMDFGLRFNGPYWIHAGPLPGWPDSHGCIRLMREDARWLFEWSRVGTPTLVTDRRLSQKSSLTPTASLNLFTTSP
jgi:hypothetical protein